MVAPILVISIGNESRGDDALAPLLLRSLARWLEATGRIEQFELLDEFQLQIEHSLDMVGRELVIFVDAGIDTKAPYAFYQAVPGNATPFSHAITPEAVLSTYIQINQKEPPPAYVLCIRGEQFELGETLTHEAEQRLELAVAFIKELLKNTASGNIKELCVSATN